MNAIDTPNKTLFLSYSRKQTDWCEALYTSIDTDTPYQRWRDNKIPESANWWDSICVNIEGCFAFVALLTNDYLKSVYCMAELDYALKLNKPVIALMLEEVALPPQLDATLTQFARVSGLDITRVITKVLNAGTEILQRYMRGDFSTDIHPRKHLREPVPIPPKTAPAEDAVLSQQFEAVVAHGQIPTLDLVRRFSEEKSRNLRLARELLTKIAQRGDVPVYFDVAEEDADLTLVEQRHAEAERERERQKRLRDEYDGLAHYVTTLSRTAAAKAVKKFFAAHPTFPDVPHGLRRKYYTPNADRIPQPFVWLPIAGGVGTMKTNGGVALTIPSETYWMSKYPITNAQYAKFVDAKGYHERRWWTDAGWEARGKGWARKGGDWVETDTPWTQPAYWGDAKWNGAEQPVVGVSWYEAVAFCLWLSHDLGEQVMLPTEAQWQYAAQGTDRRVYPWGNDWDATRCNTNESGIGKTTPVRHYEGVGDSPFGIVDLAGNVWEWCLTDYEKNTDDVHSVSTRRLLRGGSWYFDPYFARAAFRYDLGLPLSRSSSVGFRAVLRPPSR